MDPTPSRILIVEDDETTADQYARMLRLEGHEVRTAFSAASGLEEVESSAPDAIIVDLHMPTIDGLEFVRRVRSSADSRTTPLAIVTGDYFLDDTILDELRALGVEVCFKPLWVEDLAILVQRMLNPAG